MPGWRQVTRRGANNLLLSHSPNTEKSCGAPKTQTPQKHTSWTPSVLLFLEICMQLLKIQGPLCKNWMFRIRFPSLVRFTSNTFHHYSETPPPTLFTPYCELSLWDHVPPFFQPPTSGTDVKCIYVQQNDIHPIFCQLVLLACIWVAVLCSL